MGEDRNEPDASELPSTEVDPLSSRDLERIGPYRLLQKLGEGGMGEVWEAAQEKPVRRRVALKLIKAGMDTKQVVARFESERQALALMSHASIAKVFDAGATEQGRPYFAMEYVRGEPLTHYCDRHRLSTSERLQLFLRVCDGVQHAHQKGVIHRDLKPSNVLVEVSDGKPVPKIIDFGVAKATQQRLTEKTMFTQLGVMVGTPAYMSPEQAEMTGLDVDTRTDVYSLGVMLYELLVGALPFDPKEFKAAGYDEIRRKIREEEPSRPSARITAPGEASTEAAKRRAADLPTLRRELRGDLDWIAMKALAKDRTRRYGSPNELAADIGRHLRHEPVDAGPPSTAYRMGKFVRRHRLGVAAGAVVIVTLVVGLAAATYGLIRATRAEAQARQEAATAAQVSKFLVGLFEVSDPNQARGNEITARELLDQGAEKISRELQDQPLVRARLMTTIADVYGLLGMNDKGRPLAKEALETRREELGDLHPEVADGLMTLAHVTFAGNPDAARSLYEQAIGTYEKTVGPDHIRIAEALAMSAFTLALTGRGEEALPLMERLLAINEKALSLETPGEGATLAILGETAHTLEWLGPLLEREIEIRERVLGAEHPTLAPCLAAMGAVHRIKGDYREARRVMERALEITETAKGPDSPDLFQGLFFLGQLCLETGDYGRARELMERCLALCEKVMGPKHGSTGISLSMLGAVLWEAGEYEEAELVLERALEIFESAGGLMEQNVGGVLMMLARVRSETGELDEARETAERAVSNLEGSPGREFFLARALFVLGGIELARGEVSGAESRMQRALEIDKAVLGENHPDYVYNRACYHALFGRRDEAIRELRKAVELGYNRYVGISRDPDMDSLRGDPEFEAILAEIKQRAEAGRGE